MAHSQNAAVMVQEQVAAPVSETSIPAGVLRPAENGNGNGNGASAHPKVDDDSDSEIDVWDVLLEAAEEDGPGEDGTLQPLNLPLPCN